MFGVKKDMASCTCYESIHCNERNWSSCQHRSYWGHSCDPRKPREDNMLMHFVYHCISLYILIVPYVPFFLWTPPFSPPPQTPRIHPNRSWGLLANLERMLSKNFRRCVRRGVRRLSWLPWDAEKWGAPSPSSSSSWNDSSWFVYIYK